MKRFLKISLTVFTIFISIINTLAQDQLQLAVSYYNQKEYEKAAPIFKKLYQQRDAKYYFNYYLQCLINMQDYTKAEKVVKREIRRHPNNPSYLVDLAFVYEKQGREQDAERIYKKLLANIPQDKSKIIEIGNALINHRKYGIAEKFYLKAQKKFGYRFYSQLYIIYALQKDNQKLVSILLEWLAVDPSQLNSIKQRLLPYIQHDVNNEFSNLLESLTIEMMRKNRDISFNQLLIWFYTEKKQLSKALEMAVKLDKKLHGFGKEIYNVGINAKDYDSLSIAEKAFEYLISKGPQYPYYIKAKIQLLDIYYKRIQNHQITSNEEIRKVEDLYISVINEFGINSQTIDILIQLAHLEAFYLNNPNKALGYIDAIFKEVPYLSPQTRGKLLLEQGNILLSEGKLWDAILLFNKVSQNAADTTIAFRASLLLAKTWFFTGNIKVAELYFRKIRGFTRQLQDNQAIMYTYFINLADDSLKQEILRKFAKAEYYDFRNIPDSASLYYDSVVSYTYFLADRALMQKAQMFYRIGQYSKAIESLEFLINNFVSSPVLDKAYFLAAEIYRSRLMQKDKAKEYYKKIIFDMRDSPYVAKARKYYTMLLQE